MNYDSGCQDGRSKDAVTTETSSPDATRTLRADARRNRERILESARAVFAEAGADAQMDDVARRAGVGVGTVYRHFPTKEALMVELVRQKFRLFGDRMRAALEREGDPFEALADVMRLNAETAAKDAATQLAITSAGDHIWRQASAEQEELLALTDQLIARARRAGTIRPDVRGSEIGMLMCGVCSSMGFSLPGFDWRRHLDLVIDTLKA